MPGNVQQLPGGEQRLQHRLQQPVQFRARVAVDGGLRIGVGDVGGGAHHGAEEAVATFPPRGIDHHLHRHHRAVLPRFQGAEIGRQPFRQHRCDPVGEVDGDAAQLGIAVDGAVGADVPGDVGDGDGQAIAAGIVRVVIGHRVDRVIMVAGVGRVDGDQRHVPQVGPVARFRDRHGLRRRTQRGGGELARDLVGLQRQQGDGARVVEAADHLHHLAQAGSQRTTRQGLHQHQVAGDGTAIMARLDDHLLPQLAVGGLHPAAATPLHGLLVDAEDPAWPDLQPVQHPRLVHGTVAPQPGEELVTGPGRRAAHGLLHQLDAWWRRIRIPLHRAAEQGAVLVRLRHLDDADGGQALLLPGRGRPPFPWRMVLPARQSL